MHSRQWGSGCLLCASVRVYLCKMYASARVFVQVPRYSVLSDYFWMPMTARIFHLNGWCCPYAGYLLAPEMERSWLFVIISNNSRKKKQLKKPNREHIRHPPTPAPCLYFIFAINAIFLQLLFPAPTLLFAPFQSGLKDHGASQDLWSITGRLQSASWTIR